MMVEILDVLRPLLPEHKPHYLMVLVRQIIYLKVFYVA